MQSVAVRHGGGGHRNAAGCTIAADEDAVLALLLPELEQTLVRAVAS